MLLADAPAEADDETLRATLAELAAGASELSLRARIVNFDETDSKIPGPLVELFDLKPAFDGLYSLLRYGGGHEARDQAMPLLDLTRKDDGPALAGLVSSEMFRFLPEGIGFETQHWRPLPIEPLLEAWDALPDGSRLVGEFLNYYWLYAQHQQEASDRKRLFACYFDREHLRTCIDPVLARLEALPATRRGFYGTRMFLAKLESLRDREAAAAMFREALTIESPMRAAATFDGGAATYFSHRQITEAGPTIDARRAELLASLKVVSAPASGRREPLFLFSTDLRFLAIYLPQWLAQADYCKARGLDFHFTVIGDPAEVADALDRAEVLRRSLAGVRGADPDTYADNVTYSTWIAPDWCPEPVTFYACARYIGLGELTRRLGRDILVQDMDFTLKDDPAEFLSNFPLEGFGVQASYGLYGLDAWRRVMGGTFFAPDSDWARDGLRPLEAYLIEGLARGRSWYLDQNALAYFLEQTRDARLPLRQLKLHRPTEQPRINRMFEALQP